MEVLRSSTSTLIIVLVFAAGVIYQAKAYTSVTVPTQQADAMGRRWSAHMNAQPVTLKTQKPKFAILTVIHPYSRHIASVRSITYILLLIHSFFFSVCLHKLVGIARKHLFPCCPTCYVLLECQSRSEFLFEYVVQIVNP